MPSLPLSDGETRLLNLLRENARRPVAELARILGVSRTTVQNRIARLEDAGVIGGYSVILGEDYRAGRLRAHVLIVHAPRMVASIVSALRRMDVVERIYTVSGPYDLLVEIETDTAARLDEELDRIAALDGVERTTTLIILATKLER